MTASTTCPRAPRSIFANEYFDVLPIHQAVKRETGWHERVVNLDANGRLVFGASAEPIPRFEVLLPPLVRAAPVGAVFEWRPDSEIMKIATRVRDQDGAALIIDYGHMRSDAGDTFQAIARHSFADPLKNPGQADVTAHVDFQALTRAAEDLGARVHGPATQGDFLKRLGIETRAVTLMGKTTAEVSADISSALKRLTDSGRGGMGSMFKVLAITEPHLTSVAGLSDDAGAGDRYAMTFGSSLLSAIPGLRHAFFTREGGVSGGIYEGLNGGLGSNDDPAHVAENRRRMAEQMGVAPAHFLSVHQIHSPDAVVATGPWPGETRPRADAIVTRTEGLAIGVTAADCGPILFADPAARVIGAAHAGWKGALTGVLESTIDAMERLGADRGATVAAIGPLIRQHSYEVGGEFVERFLDRRRRQCHLLYCLGPAWSFDVRSRRLHPDAAGARRRARDRRHRRRHLFRRALLQLPPLGPPQRDRLRPPCSCDRAGTVIVAEVLQLQRKFLDPDDRCRRAADAVAVSLP